MQIATDVNKLVGDVDGDLSVTSFIRCKDIYACPSVLYLCVHNNFHNNYLTVIATLNGTAITYWYIASTNLSLPWKQGELCRGYDSL